MPWLAERFSHEGKPYEFPLVNPPPPGPRIKVREELRKAESRRSVSFTSPESDREAPLKLVPVEPDNVSAVDEPHRSQDEDEFNEDRLFERAMIFSNLVNHGTLRGAAKLRFQDTVAWAEFSRRGNIAEFRKLAKGKGKKAFPQLNVECDFRELKQWLRKRELLDYLRFGPLDRNELLQMVDSDKVTEKAEGEASTSASNHSYAEYSNPKQPLRAGKNWISAYHGTWFYSLWSILYHGLLLESSNTSKGHEFWEPGVYVSPSFKTARDYARPHQLFGDGNFYRCVLKVLYDPDQVRKERDRGGGQVVIPGCAVVIVGVIFCADDPPFKGEERFEDWQEDLEVKPKKKEFFDKKRAERKREALETQPPPPEANVEATEREGLKSFLTRSRSRSCHRCRHRSRRHGSRSPIR